MEVINGVGLKEIVYFDGVILDVILFNVGKFLVFFLFFYWCDDYDNFFCDIK